MTAVWTAMSLKRSDVASNSLSRSLSSLMRSAQDESVDEEEEDEDQCNATVVLHSNMAPVDPSPSTQDPHSRWSMDSETQSSAPFVRQQSVPNPQFQKLVTDSASSITFLGKRITREYQSHFVLPDKQMVAVVRKETFLPEEAHSEVTLSLSVAAPPEVADTTQVRGHRQMKKRICEYLDPDDWASAILASSESRDAELLGRLGPKYSSSIARRSRLERSTSRKSRQEIVLARELYSDEDEEAADVKMSSDEDVRHKLLRSPPQSPKPDRAYPPPNYSTSRPSELIGTPKKTPPPPPPPPSLSKFTPSSASPKSPSTPPLISAHAELPGSKVRPLSDVRSRLNFEELRRKWDERVAREQMHLDERMEQSKGTEQSPTIRYHHDGHRGSAVTSILPVHLKHKSRDSRTGSELLSRADTDVAEHERSSTQRYLANRTNTLPDPTYGRQSPHPGSTSDLNAEPYPHSPLSVLSEPATDHEEKEAKFFYSHEKLRIGQENLDRMDPTIQGSRTSTGEAKRPKSYSELEQFDRYATKRPTIPPRTHDPGTSGPTEMLGPTPTKPTLPPKPRPGDYKSAQKAAETLWERRQKMSQTISVEQKNTESHGPDSRPLSVVNISINNQRESAAKDKRRGRVWDENIKKLPHDTSNRSGSNVTPGRETDKRRDSAGKVGHSRTDPQAKAVERKESDRKADRARSQSTEVVDPYLGYGISEDFVRSPEPREPLPPAELQPTHTEAPPTPMGRWRKAEQKVQKWQQQSENFVKQSRPDPSELAPATTVRRRSSQTEKPKPNGEVSLSGRTRPNTTGKNDQFNTETGVVDTEKVTIRSTKDNQDDLFGVLAPQPYRSRREVPIPDSSVAEKQNEKQDEIQEQSSNAPIKSRRPRPFSMNLVPSTPGFSSTDPRPERKLIRRKSDMDRHLDEQIDQAYSEELRRRESLHDPNGGRHVDLESSSGLSALATYEEQKQRAKQLDDILNRKQQDRKPGFETNRTTAAVAITAVSGVKEDPAKSTKPQAPTKESSRKASNAAPLRRQSDTKTTDDKRTSPDKGQTKEVSNPQEYTWERMAKILSANDYLEQQSSSFPSNLSRSDAKRQPLVRSTSVKQPDQRKPISSDYPKEAGDYEVMSPNSTRMRSGRKEPFTERGAKQRPRSDSDLHYSQKPDTKMTRELEDPEIAKGFKRRHSSTKPEPEREPASPRKEENKHRGHSHSTRKPTSTSESDRTVDTDEKSETEKTDTTIKQKQQSIDKIPTDSTQSRYDPSGHKIKRWLDKDQNRKSPAETRGIDQSAVRDTHGTEMPRARKSHKDQPIESSDETNAKKPSGRRRPASHGEKDVKGDVKEAGDPSASHPGQSTWPRHLSKPYRSSRHPGVEDGVEPTSTKTKTPKHSLDPVSPRGQAVSSSKLTGDDYGGDSQPGSTSKVRRRGSKSVPGLDKTGKGEFDLTGETGRLSKKLPTDPSRDPMMGEPKREHGRTAGRPSKRMNQDEPGSEWLADQYNRYDQNIKPPYAPLPDDEYPRHLDPSISPRWRGSRDMEGERSGVQPPSKRGDVSTGLLSDSREPHGEGYGRKRHPPPPTSPPARHGMKLNGEQRTVGPDSVKPFDVSSQKRPPSTADLDRHSGLLTPSHHEVYSSGGGGETRQSNRPKAADGSHARNGRRRPVSDDLVPWHPDEYNLHDEARRTKHATKGAREPDAYGATPPGELRKQPTQQTYDDHKRSSDRGDRHSISLTDKEKKPTGQKPRHPSPPKPHSERKPSEKAHRSKHGHKQPRQPVNQDLDSPYMNLPGSIPRGAQPMEEELIKKSQEYSDRSNEHSSYDPRVGDLGDLGRHRGPRAQPARPSSSATLDKAAIGREKHDDRHSKHAPKASPRTQTLESGQRKKQASQDKPGEVTRAVKTKEENLYDSDDDDDLEDSDNEEELKPPPLRISHTKRSPDSLVRPNKQAGATSAGKPRPSSRSSQQKPRSSPRGSLLSPGAMSAPSTQGYFTGGPLDKSQRSGHYRPEHFHPHHYEQISIERTSRPRSKRMTASSQEVMDPRGSKHSLIISTKRRTLSGVTGTNPIKQRSSSMNALWFGDHPVPSSGALSPEAPFRLSAIQLQAQAELERRHRSSSRAHSLDRRSGLSHYGTASHLSRAPTEIEGYEGVGYGYDSRGRLIHGGAPLQERAISRKRRLLDGHESLSRVWIPEPDMTERPQRSGDPSPSAATRLTERKANLNESAVAFALRDFTAPGAR